MTPVILLASLTTTGYATYYLIACTLFPFGRCRHCTGTGKHRPRFGRHHRECRRCTGTGRRVRLGRRVYDYLRNEYDRGTR